MKSARQWLENYCSWEIAQTGTKRRVLWSEVERLQMKYIRLIQRDAIEFGRRKRTLRRNRKQ